MDMPNQQFNNITAGDKKPSKKIIIGVIAVIALILILAILAKTTKKPKVSEPTVTKPTVSESASKIQAQIDELNRFGQDLSNNIDSSNAKIEDLSDFTEAIEDINKDIENPK